MLAGRRDSEVADPLKNRLVWCTLPEQSAEFLVSQDKAEFSEDAKVHRNARTHDEKEGMHRLTIDGVEVHRMLQKEQRHEGAIHMQEDGVADVRNCDAATNAGRPHRLARLEHGQDVLTIHLFGEAEASNHR